MNDLETARELVTWLTGRVNGLCKISEPEPAEIDHVLGVLRSIHDEAVEACAITADGFTCGICGMDGKAAAAIRTLRINASSGSVSALKN